MAITLQFIDAYFKEQGIDRGHSRGHITDKDGRVLGEHAGVHQFTVGQRKGLGIASARTSVRDRNGAGDSDRGRRSAMMICCGARASPRMSTGSASIALPEPMRAQVKIRNKHVAAGATIFPTGDRQSGGSSLR